MTHYPGPAPQPAPPRPSRRLTRDQAAMLTVAISVFAILGAMVFLGVRELPDALAEPTPEPEPPVAADETTAAGDDDETEEQLEYVLASEAEPETPEHIALSWNIASQNYDEETLEELTCASPPANIAGHLQTAADTETTDYEPAAFPYVTSREVEGATEVAFFLNDQDPTYEYIWAKESRPDDTIAIFTVVEEDGAWAVCGLEALM
ncbi:hypothetical protein [Glycomyces salinus]|uniref:hypothetical protein n=1 Tax=Glycomyces salinus TaxID=980294 RepID=UPI0018ED0558|nr:hypothetical protein [Glycomyces salinus]